LTSIEIPDLVQDISGNAFTNSGLQTVIISAATANALGKTSPTDNPPGVSFFGKTVATELPPPTPDTTILVYNADQNPNFLWDGVTYTLDPNLPPYSYRSETTTGILVNQVPNAGSLIEVTIGNIVTGIGGSAFQGCTNLTSITIPASVKSISISAFLNCSSLTSINVDLNNTNYSSLGGVLFNKTQTTLIQFPCGNSGSYTTMPNTVKTIGNSAFRDCIGLLSITIPNSVRTIGSLAFYNCNMMTTVTFVSNSILVSFGNSVFYDCNKLTSLIIPDSVTTIGDELCFDCFDLTSVTLPNNPSFTNIGSFSFAVCTSLTSITIPASVTTITGNAFNGSNLQTVTIGKDPQTISGILYTAGSTPVSFFGRNVIIVYP